jgi:hypothetical protein
MCMPRLSLVFASADVIDYRTHSFEKVLDLLALLASPGIYACNVSNTISIDRKSMLLDTGDAYQAKLEKERE